MNALDGPSLIGSPGGAGRTRIDACVCAFLHPLSTSPFFGYGISTRAAFSLNIRYGHRIARVNSYSFFRGTRPRGRPSHAPLVRYRSFHYQAASWDRPRRVIAKVEHHLGELFPRVGFIVTTLTGTNRAIVHFYNQRGTAEQWIKEGKEATHWTRLSCHRFRANEVRLLLGVIAYNLGNLLRRLALPLTIESWSLTSLQQRLFKTGGRLIRHARYFVLQLAESHLTSPRSSQILGRIERLAWHPT